MEYPDPIQYASPHHIISAKRSTPSSTLSPRHSGGMGTVEVELDPNRKAIKIKRKQNREDFPI
jgi:hypothetical protein